MLEHDGWMTCDFTSFSTVFQSCQEDGQMIMKGYKLASAVRVKGQGGQMLEHDGWMTCDFTSFSIAFQSYQDDGQMIMKDCVKWNPVYS